MRGGLIEVQAFERGDILTPQIPTGCCYWVNSVNVRSEPSIFAKKISDVLERFWPDCYNPEGLQPTRCWDRVEYLGEEENGWIKIKHLVPGVRGLYSSSVEGWVYGELYGFQKKSEYRSSENSKTFRVVADHVIARTNPTLLSNPNFHTFKKRIGHHFPEHYSYSKGDRVTIIGQKGNWFKIKEGNWIYYELVEVLE